MWSRQPTHKHGEMGGWGNLRPPWHMFKCSSVQLFIRVQWLNHATKTIGRTHQLKGQPSRSLPLQHKCVACPARQTKCQLSYLAPAFSPALSPRPLARPHPIVDPRLALADRPSPAQHRPCNPSRRSCPLCTASIIRMMENEVIQK